MDTLDQVAQVAPLAPLAPLAQLAPLVPLGACIGHCQGYGDIILSKTQDGYFNLYCKDDAGYMLHLATECEEDMQELLDEFRSSGRGIDLYNGIVRRFYPHASTCMSLRCALIVRKEMLGY